MVLFLVIVICKVGDAGDTHSACVLNGKNVRLN